MLIVKSLVLYPCILSSFIILFFIRIFDNLNLYKWMVVIFICLKLLGILQNYRLVHGFYKMIHIYGEGL